MMGALRAVTCLCLALTCRVGAFSSPSLLRVAGIPKCLSPRLSPQLRPGAPTGHIVQGLRMQGGKWEGEVEDEKAERIESVKAGVLTAGTLRHSKPSTMQHRGVPTLHTAELPRESRFSTRFCPKPPPPPPPPPVAALIDGCPRSPRAWGETFPQAVEGIFLCGSFQGPLFEPKCPETVAGSIAATPLALLQTEEFFPSAAFTPQWELQVRPSSGRTELSHFLSDPRCSWRSLSTRCCSRVGCTGVPSRS